MYVAKGVGRSLKNNKSKNASSQQLRCYISLIVCVHNIVSFQQYLSLFLVAAALLLFFIVSLIAFTIHGVSLLSAVLLP